MHQNLRSQYENNAIANDLLYRQSQDLVITDDGYIIGDITPETRALLEKDGIIMTDEKSFYCG